MTRPPERRLASLLARLRNQARAAGLRRDTMLLLYLQEALLARLSVSEHRDRLVLKGGLNLYSRYGGAARPTRDIDLAALRLANTVEAVVAAVRDVVTTDLGDDVRFDARTIEGEAIQEGAAYGGVRIRVDALFESATERLILDISFGNAITPGPVVLAFPALLGGPPHHVLGYPLETIVAEKFAAAVELGVATTRLKDFYDLHRIATTEILEASSLGEALARTFAARGTPLGGSAAALLALARDPGLRAGWKRFITRQGLAAPNELPDVIGPVHTLLAPIVDARTTNGGPNDNPVD